MYWPKRQWPPSPSKRTGPNDSRHPYPVNVLAQETVATLTQKMYWSKPQWLLLPITGQSYSRHSNPVLIRVSAAAYPKLVKAMAVALPKSHSSHKWMEHLSTSTSLSLQVKSYLGRWIAGCLGRQITVYLGRYVDFLAGK